MHAAPEVVSFRSTAVDEVQAALANSFEYPLSVSPLGDPAPFAFNIDILRLGPLTLGDVRYGTTIRVDAPDLESYHINVPLDGYQESRHRNVAVTATPARAVVYRPVGEIQVRRISADCRTLALKIERRALESQLESLLGHAVDGPLRLGPSLDVSTGPGLTWLRMLRMLAAEGDNPDGLLGQPLVAECLSDGLQRALLLAVDHEYREALARPHPPSRPRTVKRAIDAMHAHADQPLTMAGLAEIAGTSVRSLQEGFKRHVGMAPMAYLRQVRLARVHAELQRAGPGRITVAKVAHRWGFPHLGRFAAVYRERYGVAPSQTLREGG